jgi:hypothetical protein
MCCEGQCRPLDGLCGCGCPAGEVCCSGTGCEESCSGGEPPHPPHGHGGGDEDGADGGIEGEGFEIPAAAGGAAAAGGVGYAIKKRTACRRRATGAGASGAGESDNASGRDLGQLAQPLLELQGGTVRVGAATDGSTRSVVCAV